MPTFDLKLTGHKFLQINLRWLGPAEGDLQVTRWKSQGSHMLQIYELPCNYVRPTKNNLVYKAVNNHSSAQFHSTCIIHVG